MNMKRYNMQRQLLFDKQNLLTDPHAQSELFNIMPVKKARSCGMSFCFSDRLLCCMKIGMGKRSAQYGSTFFNLWSCFGLDFCSNHRGGKFMEGRRQENPERRGVPSLNIILKLRFFTCDTRIELSFCPSYKALKCTPSMGQLT